MKSTAVASARHNKKNVGTLGILIAGILLLCTIGLFLFYHENVNLTTVELKNTEVDEYKHLLLRAKELTRKYKSLTGATSLPDELTLKASVNLNMEPNPVTTEDSFKLERRNNPFEKGASSDLVLGMAQDTDSKNLAVFCKSLRSVSAAEAIIFVNVPIPAKHAEIAKETHVQLEGFDMKADIPSQMQAYHPSTLRWVLFHRYFQRNRELRSRYMRIWLIDVRDSYFQLDPFSFIKSHTSVTTGSISAASSSSSSTSMSFHVFNGVESFPIKQCGWNGGWIRDCFGDAVLREVGGNGIICSGVSAGSADAVLAYIQLMHDIVSGSQQMSSPPATVPSSSSSSGVTSSSSGIGSWSSPAYAAVKGNKFPTCERNGVDQGVHNVLVHSGALGHLNVQRWGQKEGPVANMQSRVLRIEKEGSSTSPSSMVVKNQKGAIVNVVHQYDRYPELQKYLFSKYVDWVKTGDLAAEWNYESACAAYTYRPDTDLFKGMCDLKMKGGVTGPPSCCQLCNAMDKCKAFTFFSGSCFFKTCHGVNSRSRGQHLAGAVSAYLT
mmetsp:Transcript_25763/g.42987  ORF Transcript_25763/g.42987 Transcript_25763/m.42987 type:complete len:551 (-) Transcript_25763:52-1704(-)